MALLPFLVLLVPEGLAGNRTTSAAGTPLSWQADSIPFVVDLGGKHGLGADDVDEAIRLGAEQWNADGSWVSLEYRGERAATDASSNETNEVFFADTWTPDGTAPGEAGYRDPGLLALTYVWSISDTGEIIEFDIAINADDHDWSVSGEEGRNDLWNAMSHEFGHGLGFDHSEDEDATMYWSTSPGDIAKRDLAEDDMNLFSQVYGGSFPYAEVARMGCSTTGGGAPAGLAVLVGLVGLVARRRNDEEEA